jgi:hypothetical protein
MPARGDQGVLDDDVAAGGGDDEEPPAVGAQADLLADQGDGHRVAGRPEPVLLENTILVLTWVFLVLRRLARTH